MSDPKFRRPDADWPGVSRRVVGYEPAHLIPRGMKQALMRAWYRMMRARRLAFVKAGGRPNPPGRPMSVGEFYPAGVRRRAGTRLQENRSCPE